MRQVLPSTDAYIAPTREVWFKFRLGKDHHGNAGNPIGMARSKSNFINGKVTFPVIECPKASFFRQRCNTPVFLGELSSRRTFRK